VTADDRYDVSSLLEAQFEPGSSGLVLKNLLGITSKEVMDEAEARALEQAMDVLIRAHGETHRFTAAISATVTAPGLATSMNGPVTIGA
jgi:cell filamentation protein